MNCEIIKLSWIVGGVNMFTHSSKKDSSKISSNKEKASKGLEVSGPLSFPQNVMQLQSTIGNSAVLQLMKSQSPQHASASANSLADHFKMPNMPQVVIQKKQTKNATGLPDKLKTGVEGLSGLSMDDVRVHYNSDKPAQVGALAYTKGTDIHVGPRQEKYLPHEVWHVVQQAQGKVRPTMHMKGVGINENETFEHEADIMGEKFKSGAFQNYTPSQEENTGISLYHNNVLEPITLNNDLPIQMVKYVIVQSTQHCKRVDDDYELKWGERLATQSEVLKPMEPKLMEPPKTVPKPMEPPKTVSKPMVPKIIAPTHQVGVDYPRGFFDYQDFLDKTRLIAQQARNGRIIASGSSVTGFSFKTKKPFRKGGTPRENSDIDMGIVDPELAYDSDQVGENGFPVPESGLSEIESIVGEKMRKQNKHKMGIKAFSKMPRRTFIERPHTPVKDRKYDEEGYEILHY